jgi:predicted nucleic acid-binding protein
VRRHRLFAPELLVAECANILWKKTRLGELSTEEALFAARLLQRADIELAPMRALLEPATRLAIILDHPAYDCVYVALAESLGCDLVSADRRLAAKPLPAGCSVKVLTLAAGAAG